MYKEYIDLFIEKAKANHPVIKFTTEVSEIETTFSQRELKKGFVKGEGLRLLRTNSSKEVKHERKEALKQKLRTRKRFHSLSRSFNRHFQTWKAYGQMASNTEQALT